MDIIGGGNIGRKIGTMSNNSQNLPPKEPKTLFEFLWYLKRWEDGIYVKVKRNDKDKILALVELNPKEWAEKVSEFIEYGAIPSRVLENWEVLQKKFSKEVIEEASSYHETDVGKDFDLLTLDEQIEYCERAKKNLQEAE